jgi:protein-tyrosine phosphatase
MTRRILFVCTGNICRSPTAQGVLRHLVASRGLTGKVEAASAGLEDWHAGAPPDPRTVEHALRRGYDLAAQRARKIARGDFERFDWVVAMDAEHHARLRRLAAPAHAHKLRHAGDFASSVPPGGVPDPYYGGADGFETVLDQVEAICEGVLAQWADLPH